MAPMSRVSNTNIIHIIIMVLSPVFFSSVRWDSVVLFPMSGNNSFDVAFHDWIQPLYEKNANWFFCGINEFHVNSICLHKLKSALCGFACFSSSKRAYKSNARYFIIKLLTNYENEKKKIASRELNRKTNYCLEYRHIETDWNRTWNRDHWNRRMLDVVFCFFFCLSYSFLFSICVGI